ncbi:MAG TPA: hypothetical protein VGP24_07085 [Glaciihabitans sp.]|nr:hypothetical protein [Glaciihabitans sp.]
MSLQQRAVFAVLVGVLSATFSVGFVAPAIAAPALPVPVMAEFGTVSEDAPVGGSEKGATMVESPVVDVAGVEDAHTLTPIILVAGLGVMFAAILMVVRSGSSKDPEPEQISPLTDRS